MTNGSNIFDQHMNLKSEIRQHDQGEFSFHTSLKNCGRYFPQHFLSSTMSITSDQEIKEYL